MNAYSEGYEAFHSGIGRNYNPCADRGREWQEWFAGWDDARDEAVDMNMHNEFEESGWGPIYGND